MSVEKRRSLLFVALAAFVAGVMFMSGCLLVEDLSDRETAGAARAAPKVALTGLGQDTIADIVEDVGPAVVKIDTVKISQEMQMDPFWDDPFFRYFFGAPAEPRTRRETGLGSGFIISSDGYILTNEHVINGAVEINVTVQGRGKAYPARVVGADYDLDLAVLKIDAGKNLPYLELGDSDKVKVGHWVIAIGNPYGFDHTVTLGVISAKGRPVPVEGRYYKDLLQTDAAINPGNSGGPLLNLEGKVIGINTAVAQAQGIGFAIPANTVKKVLDDLMAKGKVVRPWIGIQMHDLTPQLARYFGLESASGVIVVGVIPGGPAEKAGLKQGDIILEVQREKVENADELAEIVQKSKIGEKLLVLIYRNASKFYVTIEVGEKPAQLR